MAAATRSPRGSSIPVSGSTDRKAAQRVQDALHRPEPICDRAAQRLAVPVGQRSVAAGHVDSAPSARPQGHLADLSQAPPVTPFPKHWPPDRTTEPAL